MIAEISRVSSSINALADGTVGALFADSLTSKCCKSRIQVTPCSGLNNRIEGTQESKRNQNALAGERVYGEGNGALNALRTCRSVGSRVGTEGVSFSTDEGLRAGSIHFPTIEANSSGVAPRMASQSTCTKCGVAMSISVSQLRKSAMRTV